MSLESLNTLAVGLNEQLQKSSVSFISTEKKDTTLQLKFDVAKHVIDVRLKERDEAKDASERSAKKQVILEILAKKKNAELEGKSIEELTTMVNSL